MKVTIYRKDFKPLGVGQINPNYSYFDDLLWEVAGIDEQEAQEIDEFTIDVDQLSIETDKLEGNKPWRKFDDQGGAK